MVPDEKFRSPRPSGTPYFRHFRHRRGPPLASAGGSTPAKPEPLCRHRSPMDSRCGLGKRSRRKNFDALGHREHRNFGVSDVDAVSRCGSTPGEAGCPRKSLLRSSARLSTQRTGITYRPVGGSRPPVTLRRAPGNNVGARTRTSVSLRGGNDGSLYVFPNLAVKRIERERRQTSTAQNVRVG